MFPRHAFWFLLASACLAPSGSPGPLPQDRVVFSNITHSHGMQPAGITALLQDRRGNHWMATAAGLTKFDGVELTHYAAGDGAAAQVPGNIVALAEDVDHSLWLGSDGEGLCRFEPAWGVRERFRATTGGLPHNCVTCLQVDDQAGLWIGTRAGLCRLERSSLAIQPVRIQPREALEEIAGLQLDSGGNLWAAVARLGIFRRSAEGRWEPLWPSHSDGIRMVLGPDRNLWAFLVEDGLLEIPADGGKVLLHEIPRAVLDRACPDGKVVSMEADAFGDLWLGTGGGLLKYAVAEKRWLRFEHGPAPGSLVRGGITALLADRRSLLWAASDQGELSWHRLTRYWFPGISAEPGGLYSNEVNGFSTARDGGVWIATSRGLNRLEVSTGAIGRVPLATGPDAAAYTEILSVLEDRSGRLWVGTRRDGLAMRPPGAEGFRVFRHSPAEPGSLPDGSVTALFEDGSGQVWAAVMGHGVLRFSPGNGEPFRQFLPQDQPADLLFVNDFEPDGGAGAWLATVGGGLWHLDTASGTMEPLGARVALQRPLPSNNLLDVLRGRDGNLWIGTVAGGLLRLDPGSGTVEQFDRWEGRLPGWSACSLLEDYAGMIWAGTSEGLLRLDPRGGGLRRFGLQDGLQSPAFRARSAERLADGRLLFGGNRGFNLIDPGRLPAALPPPRPLLTGLELNGEPVKPGDRRRLLHKPLALTTELRLPHDPRMRFALRYGTVFFAEEGQVSFRFRMDPLDRQWQKDTGERRATYQGLKPGDYQFVVQTSCDGHNWNGATASIRVAVLPPWFRTWWATLLGLAAAAAAASLLGRSLHRRRLAEQRAERERIENERNQAEAALARQLQHAMLVERTVADFRNGLDAKAIFESTLERLSAHLRLSRCLVYWEPGAEEEGCVLAEYVSGGGAAAGQRAGRCGERCLDAVLRSESAVVLHRPDPAGDPAAWSHWLACWGEDAASVLAVRTVYEQRPNGALVLQTCGAGREWTADERHVAESIAGHFGLVLAQFGLSQRESIHRRELEEARLRADAANRAKSAFLAKITHELRTPLNAIIGFAEILEKESSTGPHQREAVDIISSSAEHLLGVINEVLEISKLEAGKGQLTIEEVDLPKLLRSVHGMLSVNAARKGLRFELVPVGDLPLLVEADKAKLRQVLVNLLSNAVKFTETGGVSLRAMARPRACPDGPVASPGRLPVELVFEVLDTGPGIAPEELGGLFQQFVQTRTGRRSSEGTGLGLAIARGFAELMGGSLDVVSRVGVGSLFTVRMPAWEIRKAPVKGRRRKTDREIRAAEPEVAAVPAGIRVLVAEDQPVNRLLLRKVLERAGCVIEEAEHGRAAVEKWKSFQPDIILMDESMPVMSGTEATREILAQAGGAPPAIISLTAYAMEEQREAALAAGCSDFLAKPFKQQDLYAMLARYALPQGRLRQAA